MQKEMITLNMGSLILVVIWHN